MRNIAIAGKFAVGKTSVANILEANHGYIRMSIASSLKQFVNEMYARDVYGSDENALLQKSDIVFINAAEGRKAVSVRQLLQDIGNTMKNTFDLFNISIGYFIDNFQEILHQ